MIEDPGYAKVHEYQKRNSTIRAVRYGGHVLSREIVRKFVTLPIDERTYDGTDLHIRRLQSDVFVPVPIGHWIVERPNSPGDFAVYSDDDFRGSYDTEDLF